MIILRTCDIWSFLYSDTGTHISDPSEFYQSVISSVDYQ